MSAENLLHWYRLATHQDMEEARWYWAAHEQCKAAAAAAGVDFKAFVYAVAVLSPRCSWDVNIKAASEVASNGTTNYGLKVNRLKAIEILAGNLEALRGQKVTRFALSILNPNKYVAREVVVDVWAWRAWSGHLAGETTLSAKQYDTIAADYKAAAEEAGLLPGEFQAVVWVVVRRLARKHGQLSLDI